MEKVRVGMRSASAEVRNAPSMWQNAIGKVKNFLPALGISSAIISGFNKLRQLISESTPAYREYDDKLADVMKTTGLAKDETEALSKSLKKIDTRTPQNELLDLARVAGKLGIDSAKEVEGFVRAADKINVALSEDLGGNAEEALNEVGIRRLKDFRDSWKDEEAEAVNSMETGRMDLSNGKVTVRMLFEDGYYYQILSDFSGLSIADEYQLMQQLKDLAAKKSEYDKIQNAVEQVRARGYGVVTPERSEIVLDEPVVIRHGNRYGVKMKAEAPSINLIRAQIQTEIAPIVGSEQQAQDLIAYMKDNANREENGIWETNIFGKSIEQIVEDGIQAKVSQMTEECQAKLQDALQKIINDSNGGLICIII